MNPYRAFIGQLWKKRDIQEWNERTYLAFFECVDRFTKIKDGDYKISMTTEELMKLEQDAFKGQYPFLLELVTRIDCHTTNPVSTPYKFYQRFAACVRMVGGYLKQNPSLVSDAMRAVIVRNPRLSWCLVHFEIKDTKPGVSVVTDTKLDDVGPDKQLMANPDPKLQIMETDLKLTDLAHKMVKGLKPKDLENLSTKDRISLALAITKSKRGGSAGPNVGVLNQLVINKASRDDLEKAMLEFNQNKV